MEGENKREMKRRGVKSGGQCVCGERIEAEAEGAKEKERWSEEQEIRDEKACLRWRKYSRGFEARGLCQKSYADVTGCTPAGFHAIK